MNMHRSTYAHRVAHVSLAALVIASFASGCGSVADPGADPGAPTAIQGDATGAHDLVRDEETGLTTCKYPFMRGDEDDEKWAHLSGGWNHVVDDVFNPILWRATGSTAGVTQAQFVTAVQNAFNAWDTQSYYNFRQADATEKAEITIQLALLDGPPVPGKLNVIGNSQPTVVNGIIFSDVITFDSGDSWSVNSPAPAGSSDIQAVATHEIGHAMGLDHSNPPGVCANPDVSCPNGPVMWWMDGGRRTVSNDDRVSARTKLPIFRNVSGISARSITAGGDGSIWLVDTTHGTNGYGLHRFLNSTWTQIGGHGIEIAVQGDGTAWHVNEPGSTYRYNGSGWDKKGTVAMSQIAAGGSGVWALGLAVTRGTTEHTTYQWSASANDWVSMGGEAIDIAVDSAGVAWHLNAAGSVYRRVSGSWKSVTAPPGTPKSIEAGADGTVFVTTVDSSGARRIYVWNEQTPITKGAGSDTPAGVGWMFIPGYDTNSLDITSTTGTQFWTVTSNNVVANTSN